VLLPGVLPADGDGQEEKEEKSADGNDDGDDAGAVDALIAGLSLAELETIMLAARQDRQGGEGQGGDAAAGDDAEVEKIKAERAGN
jgi:hypothetical protein